MEQNNTVNIQVIGEDVDREQRLKEVRDEMEKLGKRRQGVKPHERGFTSSTLKGKSIGEPISYDDGKLEDLDIYLDILDINN